MVLKIERLLSLFKEGLIRLSKMLLISFKSGNKRPLRFESQNTLEIVQIHIFICRL